MRFLLCVNLCEGDVVCGGVIVADDLMPVIGFVERDDEVGFLEECSLVSTLS